MPNKRTPRFGTMQYWPRKRAKRMYPRVRDHNQPKEAKLSGFAGYKVGMTHILIEDSRSTSPTKGSTISVPVSVIECPPLKVYGIRFYKNNEKGQSVIYEITSKTNDKNIKRRLTNQKKFNDKFDNLPEYDELTLLVYTQPSMTSIGKKKPDIFEMTVGGSKDEQLTFAKDNLSKDINVTDVFKSGDVSDIHSITTGKGFSGPVKRFGVSIRNHKSEKVKRGPGSICGGWKAQGHMMYRVAFAGQMGCHQRKEFNKWIIKVSAKLDEINPKGGFVRYGLVKNPYILIKGSVGGPSKRLIRLSNAVRPHKKIPEGEPVIKYTSLESNQK